VDLVAWPDGRTAIAEPLTFYGPDGAPLMTVALAAPGTVYGLGGLLPLADGGVAVAWNEGSGTEKFTQPGLLTVDAAGVVTHRVLWDGDGFGSAVGLVASGGGFLIGGVRTIGEVYDPRLWVARCSESGVLAWDQATGPAEDAVTALDVAPGPNGGITFLAHLDASSGPASMVLARSSATGEASPFTTWVAPPGDPARALAAGANGWAVIGTHWVSWFDDSGALVWTRPIDGAEVRGVGVTAAGPLLAGFQLVITQPDVEGDAFAAGAVTQTAWLRQLDANGGALWDHLYGHRLASNDLVTVGDLADGSIVAAGTLRLHAAADGTAPACD